MKWRVSAIVFLVALAFSVGYPYPISPRTLWELVEEADQIVLADVVEVEELESGDSRARLRVREVWLGEELTKLAVTFEPRMICPAPPRYVADKSVLAFLVRSGDEWRTVGLSYGTLYPAADEVSDFRHVVRSAVSVQSDAADGRAKIDWMVDAASRPGTRWHGAYGLLPMADRLHSYYDRTERRREDDLLRREDLERIAHGFVEAPAADPTLPMILQILAVHPDPDVDEAAVAAIEALLAREAAPWWIGDALAAVLSRYGDADPEARVAPLGPFGDGLAIQQIRALWQTAKSELEIPTVPPAELAEPEVSGVGSDTPS
jgi:hypothetical protein